MRVYEQIFVSLGIKYQGRTALIPKRALLAHNKIPRIEISMLLTNQTWSGRVRFTIWTVPKVLSNHCAVYSTQNSTFVADILQTCIL